MISKEILCMRIQKTPVQKTYEISVGSDSLRVEFYGANRQFDWLEISLVYDKSDKYLTIYDSYNVEHAAKKIKMVLLENFSEAFSLTNEKFVAWSCNGCSIAPLTDYINNLVYQELPTQNECFNSADERIYLNLRASYGYTKVRKKRLKTSSKN